MARRGGEDLRRIGVRQGHQGPSTASLVGPQARQHCEPHSDLGRPNEVRHRGGLELVFGRQQRLEPHLEPCRLRGRAVQEEPQRGRWRAQHSSESRSYSNSYSLSCLSNIYMY